MNESQKVLVELCSTEERASNFLKNINKLIAIQKKNNSRVIIAFLGGTLFGMGLIYFIDKIGIL